MTPASSENIQIIERLNEILEMELSGVPRYLHYALMVRGPNRIPIVKFFQDQAIEGFNHAHIIGEKITALGGHPSLRVRPVPEKNNHGIMQVLQESLEFEREALKLYTDVLKMVGENIALEELIREFIRTETEHIEEVEKMLAKME